MSHFKNWLLLFIMAVIPCFAHGQIGPVPPPSGGGPPTGAASGCLAGTYPSPTLNSNCIPGPVLNASATNVSGSDIGARANTLFTQLTNAGVNGTVTIDPTVANGTQTTTINVPLGDVLNCQNATLSWTAGGQQIIYGSAFGGGTQALQGAVMNCNLTGSGETATAVYAGGDPNGVISPSGNFGNNLFLVNNVIKGYQYGYTHGSNAYNNVIFQTTIYDNTDNIEGASTSATNDGEATMVIGSVIANATNYGFDLNNVGDVYFMTNSHCDYNIGGCVGGTGADIEIYNTWEEAYMMPIVKLTGTSNANVVKVHGGQLVATAAVYPIVSASIASDVITVNVTGTIVGYWTGYQVQFNGFSGGLSFLDGTTATITGFSGSTFTASYTHADQALTTDAGYVHPNGDSIWHVEGYQSYVNVSDVTINATGTTDGGPLVWPANAAVGVGTTDYNTVCVHDNYQLHGFSIDGTTASGCSQYSPLSMQVGSSKASVSPSAFYQTAAQGFSLAWNMQLSGLQGEMDFVNVRGIGSGGFAFCDGAFNYSPGTCQMYINGTTGVVFIPELTPSELVATSSSSGLETTLALPSGVTATTPSTGDSSTLVATTAYVQANLSSYALLLSPTFTGEPSAPTAPPLTDNTQIGTTAYTDAAVGVEKSRAETAEALLAPLASPALSGDPTTPTASAGTSTSQIASTANVVASIPVNTTAFTHPQQAPGFQPCTVSCTPTFTYFDDFLSNSNGGGISLNTPSGNTVTYVSNANANPGVVVLTSGTTSGAGQGIYTYSGLQIVANMSTQTVPWVAEASIEPAVLPGTTSGAYSFGLFHIPGTFVFPFANGAGFILSSVNANKNDWYCDYQGSLTDTSVVATVAFHHLSLVSDGTNLHWYIDGTVMSGCSGTVASLTGTNATIVATSLAESSTSVVLDMDYWDFAYTGSLGR